MLVFSVGEGLELKLNTHLKLNDNYIGVYEMAKQPSENFTTSKFIPVKEGELRWIFIDQPGKENLQKKMVLQSSLYCKTDSDGCQALKDALEEFWKANKPAGAPPMAKSYGWTDVIEKDGEGNNVYEGDNPTLTGETVFAFWTGAVWPDGKPHEIAIYNAKGSKIALGGKKIGNGSFGAISGAMSIYDAGKGAQGVTLYLNAIQVTQFVEYSQDAGFGEEEGDFDGVATDFEGTTASEDVAQPKL